jgi:hypothetical protein
MSWQDLKAISPERGYLIPRSLLHLGPLIKQVLSTPGTSAWLTASSLAKYVRISASFDDIVRTVEPTLVLSRFSEFSQPLLSDNTRIYGFSFSGSCSGPRFLILPLIAYISRTVAPFLKVQAFLDSPRQPLSFDTQVYGFPVSGSCSGAHYVFRAPSIVTTNGLSHGPRPSHGLPMVGLPYERPTGPLQHPEHPQ